jgi:arginine decarboxylase
MANYNLLCLSSVIPPRAEIVRGGRRTPAEDFGRRLYVVMSQMREGRPEQSAHAGIAWIQNAQTKCGLFVELHGSYRARLDRDWGATLEEMRRRRSIPFGPMHSEIASVVCVERPVCALVVAVYGSEPW